MDLTGQYNTTPHVHGGDGHGRATGIGVIVHNWPCSMLRKEQHTAHSLHMYVLYATVLKLQLFLSLRFPSSSVPYGSYMLNAAGHIIEREGEGQRERRNLLLQGGRCNWLHRGTIFREVIFVHKLVRISIKRSSPMMQDTAESPFTEFAEEGK